MKFAWKFGPNPMGETEGPNYAAGIASFSNDRTGSLVREFLQNSIDAHDSSDSKPVKVAFDLMDLDVEHLDVSGLEKALHASVKSLDNDDRHREQFRRGLKTLKDAKKSGRIATLVVTDANTTGASDANGKQDKWHSLVKSVGIGRKDTLDSGGSFGVGKHAAFASTDLRTVFYSTAYRANSGKSGLEHRFSGKSILVSHEIGEKSYRATGWLEQESGQPDAVPDDFRLNSPGTRIAIPGFQKRGWEKEARETLIAQFFHAIVRENLVVRIRNKTVDAGSIDQFASDMDDKAKKMISVSRSEVVASTMIEGIGDVNLRIQVDHDRIDPQLKVVAIVRDAGMMITDRLGSMKLSPSQQMIRISQRCLGFVAIVECLSGGSRSLLREAEGPKHDEFSPDNADETEREKVRRALGELGEWVIQEIEKRAKSSQTINSDNATEVAHLIPLETRGGAAHGGTLKEGTFEISEARQSPRPPRGLTTGSSRRSRRTTSGRGNEDHDETGHGRKKKPRKRRERQPAEAFFNDVRRLPSTLRREWSAHSVRFSFDSPDSLPKRIRLYAVGEDGGAQLIKLEKAYIDERSLKRSLKVRDGEIVDLEKHRLDNGRVQIDMKATRPIADKRVEIRSV